MEAIVVTTATGVMSSLLPKLSLLLSDQYKNLKGVRRNIKFLRDELAEMNAALEKLAAMDKLDCQKKLWRDKVREMAYDIEDCIDIFMHQLGEGDDKDGLFHKTARKIRKLRVRHQIVSKIQELKTRVVEQSQSRDRYKIDESVSEPKVIGVDPRLAAMYEDAKKLVGIDGPREEITKLLMGEEDHHSQQLKVLSIVGFGGLGKTTLANQVYSEIKNKFECTAFVTVSRTPHIPKILKDILSRIGYGDTEMEDDVQKLIENLRERLTNKRYFIIIDDLWSITDWDIIKCSFVENNNASRVITTTRIYGVATASCIQSQGLVYQMKPLNELHSRSLFFKRLFDTENSCPEQFREISNQMLSKCKGVPLAITSIASLLANHKHIEAWEKIHNSMGSQLDTDPTLQWMRHVLSLSYNDLSHELRTCLLYLGMYPEDYEIPKEDLLRKWMAEGFVCEKHGLDLEEAAENCFNELMNRNMIQPCFHYDGSGEVSKCQVHDLMLDLIKLKCKEENFITIIDRKYPMNGASQVRRMSHQFHDRDMPLTVESMSASTVRSYISFGWADCMPPLSKFELLRVLDMAYSFSISMDACLDLSAINHLSLLKYVRVSGVLLVLPKKFGNLKHLMTLDMLDPWFRGKIQSDFNSLSSLRLLKLPKCVTFKNGLSKLCNLRDLSYFGIGKNSIECIRELGELTNLRNLHVICDLFGEDGIENSPKTRIFSASLNKLGNNNLRCLAFEAIQLNAPALSAQFWDNCLTRPRHLQKLVFKLSIILPKLPNWIAHADRLVHASLGVQELRSDDTKVLGQLPCLVYLGLRAERFPEKNIIIHPNTFHSLKSFLFNTYELEAIPRLTFEAEAMQQLQTLNINYNVSRLGAMQMEVGSLVGGIEHLASLEKISWHSNAESNLGSKMESVWRDAISRHPNCEAMKIDVSHEVFDENGNFTGRILNNVVRFPPKSNTENSGED